MTNQLILAFAVSAVIVVLAMWRGSLSASGAAGAMLVGTLTFGYGGWPWGALLGLFFVSSSALSHFKEDQKLAVAEKFEKGHRRDVGQVLANGIVGATAALLSSFFPSPTWYVFFLGAMAAVTADTWATELGTLSRRPPRLITNGRLVEPGTSGGISLLGTAVSCAAGLLLGLAAGYLVGQAPLRMVVGATAGLVGSLFDSLLGATIQQVYYCDVCGKETERKTHKCGHVTRPLRGWSWFKNDLVNLLASLVGGLIAVGLWLLVVSLP